MVLPKFWKVHFGCNEADFLERIAELEQSANSHQWLFNTCVIFFVHFSGIFFRLSLVFFVFSVIVAAAFWVVPQWY